MLSHTLLSVDASHATLCCKAQTYTSCCRFSSYYNQVAPSSFAANLLIIAILVGFGRSITIVG